MDVPVTPKFSFNTKQEFVYQALRDAIMRCELPPGHRLVIQAIADEYQVSPIPVREALRLLNSENLVEHRPHIGAVVAPITSSSVVEIFTLKEGLEAVTARVAVEKLTSDKMAEIETILEKMDATLRDERYEDWGDLNAAFHEAFAAATEMPMLIEMNRRVLDRWNRVRRYFFKEVVVHRLFQSQEEHHEIVQAARNGDGEAAERLVKAHNQGALRDYSARGSNLTFGTADLNR